MASRPDSDTKNVGPRKAGPDGELEQYGVWVKAEPQDIIEEPDSVPAGLSDFDLPNDSSVLSEESFLTDDEEKLLGSFEDLDTEPSASPPFAGDDFDYSGVEELPSLEEFEVPVDKETDNTPVLKGFSNDWSNDSTIDISLEELEDHDEKRETSSKAPSNDTFDSESILDLDNLDETPLPETPRSEQLKAPVKSALIEDVSSEFLESAEPAPAASSASFFADGDVTSEFLSDEESQPSGAQSSVVDDFEPIDIDLHFDDTIPTSSGRHENSSVAGFEEVSEFDDFLKEEPVPHAEGSAIPAFDDLSAVENDLADAPPPRTPAERAPAAPRIARTDMPATTEAPPASNAAASLSNELLLKIAEELSSIRKELVTLKEEFGALKQEAPRPQEPSAKLEEPEAPVAGFFDEEEDETIALTGDELDNILNTADFTEEMAIEESAPDEALPDTFSDVAFPHDDDLLSEGILPETGDYSAEPEPAIEEIRLGVFESTTIPETDEIETVPIMTEEGVLPMTEPPEDTSYLEEPLASEESLDLSEAPLEEPDLSDFDLVVEELEADTPVQASGLEPSILPIDENEEFADLTLDLADIPSADSEIAELESLSPIPEFEDAGFSEIELSGEAEKQDISGRSEEPAEVLYAEPGIEELAVEEAEELVAEEMDLGSMETLSSETLSPHPDDIPTSLDDSYFVGGGSPSEPRAEIVEELGGDDFLEEESLDEAILDETEDFEEVEAAELEMPAPIPQPTVSKATEPSDRLKSEIRSVLSYLDKLLESLPEEKIEEFAHSEHFDTYKKLFEELGLV